MRLIVLLAILGFVAAVPKNPQRIVGGTVTTINQYPFAASLLYSWNLILFGQECVGTIINNRAVVTAAHCTAGDSTNRWRIRIGTTYANLGGNVHNVQTIINHPDYWGYDSDIAILHSSTTFVSSNTIAPVSIAGANYDLAEDEVVWAIGWGRTSNNGPTSEQLRQVQVWTINQEVCTQRYAIQGITITDNMLCSGWLDIGGRDQCEGDSGGPLLHNNVLVGVSSFRISCGDPFFPSVNTRTSQYSIWIQDNA